MDAEEVRQLLLPISLPVAVAARIATQGLQGATATEVAPATTCPLPLPLRLLVLLVLLLAFPGLALALTGV